MQMLIGLNICFSRIILLFAKAGFVEADQKIPQKATPQFGDSCNQASLSLCLGLLLASPVS